MFKFGVTASAAARGLAIVWCVALLSSASSFGKTPFLSLLSSDRSDEIKTKNAPQPAAPQKPQILADVNGEQISRQELAQECLRQFGPEVLESLMNKYLIAECCRQKQISVSDQEVEAEIDRMARKFSLPKDQWLKMLEKERHIKPLQYSRDIIWPTLALRKLAASQLTVSREEMADAYDSQFGPAVKARIIVVGDAQKASSVHREAVANPDSFGALARKSSEDVNSASANGLIQPIRRHLGDPALERVAFGLKKGEISPPVQVGNQFIIVKCEDHLPPVRADRAQAEPILEDAIRDRKLRLAASEIFKNLQKNAVVENIYNDPVKSKQQPGVAGIINSHRITLLEVSEECVERHGIEVLDGVINRRLLVQALRKHNLTVLQQDIDAEIARAAIAMGKTTKTGAPDVQGWLELVTKQQRMALDLYISNAVWPSVALKKLAGNQVQITEQDLRKGFEANYGPRVRCRAIVLTSQRKAQEVWQLARDHNNDPKFFGDLAEQYSSEASSRALRGEIPPIQKHGGQPLLEREAFALHPGELSGVIQVGETFVVLLCEGFTEPTKIDFNEVRGMLYEDIREKKQRIAMAKAFEQIQDNAQIDNFLSGTIKSPKQVAMPPNATPVRR